MGWSRWSVSHPHSTEKPADRECSNSSPIANYNTLLTMDQRCTQVLWSFLPPCVTVTLLEKRETTTIFVGNRQRRTMYNFLTGPEISDIMSFFKRGISRLFKIGIWNFFTASFEIADDFFFFRQLLITFNTFLLVNFCSRLEPFNCCLLFNYFSLDSDYFYGDCVSRPPRSKKKFLQPVDGCAPSRYPIYVNSDRSPPRNFLL